MSKLSDRLNARRAELDVSTRAIADTATAAGFDMSHTTVARYLRPHHPRPTPETVEALAAGFKLSASELLRLAGLQAAGGAYVPPASSRLLTTAQRNAVSEIIRLLAEGNRDDEHTTDSPPAATTEGTQGEAYEVENMPDIVRIGYDLAALRGERARDRENDD